MAKGGWRGLVSGAIIAFLISCIVLAVGIFMSQCFLYQGNRCLENKQAIQGGAYYILAGLVNPFDISGRYSAGVVLHAAQDYDGAVIFYNKTIKRDPYYLQVRELRNMALPK